jgi:predicted Zn finger-like uncharacterized protein
MKFVCDRCQTKYSIADDKVRGKVLKVRCKTCQNVITVREAGARPSEASLAPVRGTQRPTSPQTKPLETLGEAPEELGERTAVAPAPAGLMAELISNQNRRATPPPPPALGDGVEWFLALEGAQQGPFSRKQLVDRLLTMPKDADVHVWNERMDGWKAPADVPEVAHDLAARKPALPVRPPVPRATPSPPLPPASPAASRPAPHALAGAAGSKLPLPAPHVAAAHAVPAPAAVHEEAPLPPAAAAPAVAHGHGPGVNGHAKTNGLAAHASTPAAPLPGTDTDALAALNLAAAPAAAPAPAGRPRIMEVSEATAWSGAGRVQEGRHRNTKMIVGLLGLVCVTIVLVGLGMSRKTPAPVAAAPIKPSAESDSLRLKELEEKKDPPPPPPVAQDDQNTEQTHLKKRPPAVHGRPGQRPGSGAGGAPGTEPGPGSGAAGAPVVTQDPGIRPERRVPSVPSASSRPPPSQAEITRVIANNKVGIKTCYQRALLRDSSLTHGKIVVGVTIGLSGHVKGVRVDGPSSFRSLEPCIREMVGHWAFPPAGEEYGTEFSYLFQGNE